MGSTNRNTTRQTETPVEPNATPDAPVTAEPSTEGGPDTTKPAAKPRQPVDVGDVLVAPSTRTDFSTRPSRVAEDPVYKAVAAAEFDVPVDIHALPGKVEAVKSRLRTAANPSHLKVGMHIAPTTPASPEREGHVVVTFVKTKERKEVKRKPKAEVPANA